MTQRRPFREISLQWHLSTFLPYHTGVWKQSLERLMRYICFVILGHFQSKLPALLKRILNPIQHGHFWDCSHKEKAKRPPPSLKSVTYRLQWWTSYTLPKEDSKYTWITCHTAWVLLTSALFHQKSVNFGISRSKDIDCILVHNFYFF